MKNEIISPLKEMAKRQTNDTAQYGKDYKRFEKDYKSVLDSLDKVA